ncbi:hypothetical protein NQ314_011401 [Rhamnusium bicolor]|uniref:DDE Tnp4 domain-containing protein n=1 Tax=Rhamnusium bicolor TaxID=1586634 RepID=A0AAV8XJD8_9CUCU|nr:hypothetical protein NQ314_011401 [Rhamnusium bicolor]
MPYRDNGHLNGRQRRFNQRLNSQRAAIEMEFGLLKGKWRRLKYLNMLLAEKVPHVISACCILHNFLLKNRDEDNNEMGPGENDNQVENDDVANDIDERNGGGALKRDYLVTLI